jgi:Ca2+-binding EF-hand superfamily protein
MLRVGVLSSEELDDLIDYFDTDGDGKMNYDGNLCLFFK